MTIVAYKDGIMAADKQSTYDGMPWTVTKIRRTKDGALVGCAGHTAVCRQLQDWYAGDRDPKTFPDTENQCYMLVVLRDGTIHFYDGKPVPIHMEVPFIAMGSGRDFAVAVMDIGGSAEDGVRMAMKWNNGCGLGVDVLRLEDASASPSAA